MSMYLILLVRGKKWRDKFLDDCISNYVLNLSTHCLEISASIVALIKEFNILVLVVLLTTIRVIALLF